MNREEIRKLFDGLEIAQDKYLGPVDSSARECFEKYLELCELGRSEELKRRWKEGAKLNNIEQHHDLPKHMGGLDEDKNYSYHEYWRHANKHLCLHRAFGHPRDFKSYLGIKGKAAKRTPDKLHLVEQATSAEKERYSVDCGRVMRRHIDPIQCICDLMENFQSLPLENRHPDDKKFDFGGDYIVSHNHLSCVVWGIKIFENNGRNINGELNKVLDQMIADDIIRVLTPSELARIKIVNPDGSFKKYGTKAKMYTKGPKFPAA